MTWSILVTLRIGRRWREAFHFFCFLLDWELANPFCSSRWEPLFYFTFFFLFHNLLEWWIKYSMSFTFMHKPSALLETFPPMQDLGNSRDPCNYLSRHRATDTSLLFNCSVLVCVFLHSLPVTLISEWISHMLAVKASEFTIKYKLESGT